ncbi:hypothetical protein EJB05_06784, partial [Eragrostis curvula]
MGIFDALYRVVMRRNAVYVTFVVAGAFAGERVRPHPSTIPDSHLSDPPLLSTLFLFVAPLRVVSLGDGRGDTETPTPPTTRVPICMLGGRIRTPWRTSRSLAVDYGVHKLWEMNNIGECEVFKMHGTQFGLPSSGSALESFMLSTKNGKHFKHANDPNVANPALKMSK